MDAGSIVALVGIAITMVVGTAAAVFTLMRYLQGSFGRVHERMDETDGRIIQRMDALHEQTQAKIEGLDVRVNEIDRRLVVVESTCKNRHQGDKQ